MNINSVTAEQLKSMSAEERYAFAVNVAVEAQKAMRSQSSAIEFMVETIEEQKRLISRMHEALEVHRAAKVQILDEEESLRIDGSLAPEDVRRILAAALPEIQMLLTSPVGEFHA